MSRAALDEFTIDGERWLVIAYAPPRPAAALATLTASELEVIDRWARGRSMRSIAAERRVAVRTVANQVARAYRKLGVASRAELIALFHARAADTTATPPEPEPEERASCG